MAMSTDGDEPRALIPHRRPVRGWATGWCGRNLRARQTVGADL